MAKTVLALASGSAAAFSPSAPPVAGDGHRRREATRTSRPTSAAAGSPSPAASAARTRRTSSTTTTTRISTFSTPSRWLHRRHRGGSRRWLGVLDQQQDRFYNHGLHQLKEQNTGGNNPGVEGALDVDPDVIGAISRSSLEDGLRLHFIVMARRGWFLFDSEPFHYARDWLTTLAKMGRFDQEVTIDMPAASDIPRLETITVKPVCMSRGLLLRMVAAGRRAPSQGLGKKGRRAVALRRRGEGRRPDRREGRLPLHRAARRRRAVHDQGDGALLLGSSAAG